MPAARDGRRPSDADGRRRNGGGAKISRLSPLPLRPKKRADGTDRSPPWHAAGPTATQSNRGDIDFATTLPGGTKVWLTAAWFNPRMQTGLACDPVPTQVNFGGVSKAA